MKKNGFLIISSTLLFSFLFYKQVQGINYLLFSIVLIFLLGLRTENNRIDTRWFFLAGLSLLTGVFVLLHGTVISVLANFVALSMLAVNSLYPSSSFFISFIISIYSYISSFVYFILDIVEKKPEKTKEITPNNDKKTHAIDLSTKFVIGVVGFLIVIVFFLIYRKSNPLFKNFTDKINLNFISFPWLVFTTFGFFLLYGFFKIRHSNQLYQIDVNTPTNLNKEKIESKPNTFLGFPVPLQTEVLIGIIFLAVLNVLLLILNTLDLEFILGGYDLPESVTYSEYLHKGVGNLIFSVILVIFITSYFFRGQLNYFKISNGAKTIRLLTFIWLMQNLIMLISTAYRNQSYISEYSLTYKRIGVYVWLILTAVGLITTVLKISTKKSIWYLVRINSWSFFLMIILLGSVNWDVFIARYNTRNPSDADYEYLMRLNNNAMPFVYEALKVAEPGHLFLNRSTFYNSKNELEGYLERAEWKMQSFMDNYYKRTWKSFNIADSKTIKKINEVYQ